MSNRTSVADGLWPNLEIIFYNYIFPAVLNEKSLSGTIER